MTNDVNPVKRAVRAAQETLSAEELAELEGGAKPEPAEDAPAAPANEDGSPLADWQKAALPIDIKIPPGKQVFILRFEPTMTGRADLGTRTCVLWGLDMKDEKFARRRATEGDFYRQAAMQMIRAFDAEVPNAGNPFLIPRFFDEIGPRARSFIENLYLRTHQMTNEESLNFFVNHVACYTAK